MAAARTPVACCSAACANVATSVLGGAGHVPGCLRADATRTPDVVTKARRQVSHADRGRPHGWHDEVPPKVPPKMLKGPPPEPEKGPTTCASRLTESNR
jgi:hypothetical protein